MLYNKWLNLIKDYEVAITYNIRQFLLIKSSNILASERKITLSIMLKYTQFKQQSFKFIPKKIQLKFGNAVTLLIDS